jgi:hypothetical protein
LSGVLIQAEFASVHQRDEMINTHKARYNSKLANFPRPAIVLTAVTYLLLGYLERKKGAGKFIPPLLYFLALGVLALFIMPSVLGLPNGRKSLRDYCQDIRVLPMKPLGRNIFIGLFCTFLILKTGSLLPAIIFHYIHDIFVLFVQNTPGVNETLASALLYACLWMALVIGIFSTKYIVGQWHKIEPHS